MKNYWSNWQQVQNILSVLHRRDELTQLVKWATRKQLSEVQIAYQYKLLNEEVKFNRYILQHPHLVSWARCLQFINQLVTPSSKYYPKGSAVKFRRQY